MLNGIAIQCASHHNTCSSALGSMFLRPISLSSWEKQHFQNFFFLFTTELIIEPSDGLNQKLLLHQNLNNWANLCWGIKRKFSLFFPTAVVGFLRVKGHLLPSPDPTDPTKTDEIAFNEGSDCICWFYCTYRGNYCCQRTLDVTEILSGGNPISESCWDSSRIFRGGGGYNLEW